MTEKQGTHKSKVFAVSGIKNSGKTTLVSGLVTALTSKGYKVGVIKHDGHEFEADHKGTDSYKHKAAGAQNVIVYSKTKMMMVKDLEAPNIDELIKLQGDMDVVILEGMKYSPFPKIEIVRKEISSQIICDPATLLAVVTDVSMSVGDVPIVGLDEFQEIFKIVKTYIEE